MLPLSFLLSFIFFSIRQILVFLKFYKSSLHGYHSVLSINFNALKQFLDSKESKLHFSKFVKMHEEKEAGQSAPLERNHSYTSALQKGTTNPSTFFRRLIQVPLKPQSYKKNDNDNLWNYNRRFLHRILHNQHDATIWEGNLQFIYTNLDTSYKNSLSGNKLEYLAISRGTRAHIRAATETLWIKLFIELLPCLSREKALLHKMDELTITDFMDRCSNIHIKQPRRHSQRLLQPIRHRRANCCL